jgi:hypothetical protein
MTGKWFVSGCLIAGLACGTAHAACNVTAGGSIDDKAKAQRLVRFSESKTLADAWSRGECTITKLLHGGGDPCFRGGGTNHVTVSTEETTYHVFDYRRSEEAGFCTTP